MATMGFHGRNWWVDASATPKQRSRILILESMALRVAAHAQKFWPGDVTAECFGFLPHETCDPYVCVKLSLRLGMGTELALDVPKSDLKDGSWKDKLKESVLEYARERRSDLKAAGALGKHRRHGSSPR